MSRGAHPDEGSPATTGTDSAERGQCVQVLRGLQSALEPPDPAPVRARHTCSMHTNTLDLLTISRFYDLIYFRFLIVRLIYIYISSGCARRTLSLIFAHSSKKMDAIMLFSRRFSFIFARMRENERKSARKSQSRTPWHAGRSRYCSHVQRSSWSQQGKSLIWDLLQLTMQWNIGTMKKSRTTSNTD